jgi:hypothetical protein
MDPTPSKAPANGPNLRVIDGRVKTTGRSPRRTWSPWVAVGSLGAHAVLRLLLDGWLNASSDAKVWAAVLILVLPIGFAAFALYRAIVSKP